MSRCYSIGTEPGLILPAVFVILPVAFMSAYMCWIKAVYGDSQKDGRL